MRSLLFLFAFASLIAQTVPPAPTSVPPGMLRRWGGGTLDDLRLFAVAVDGVAQVRLGPGLRLEERGGTLVLTATAAEPGTRVLEQDPNGNYVCPECTSRVYRNGIRMAPSIDYYHNGSGLIPLSPWRKDDLILAEVPQAGAIARERPTVVPAAMIQNWKQVAPNELLEATDPRRRPGVALSQVQTPPACTWWYGQRIRLATALGTAPPLTIDCSGDGLAALWQGAGDVSTGTGPAVTDPAGGDRAGVGR